MNPNLRSVALIAASLGLVVSLFIALREDDEEPTAATTTVATTTATTEQTTTTTEPTETTTEPSPTTTEPPATAAPPPERVVTIRINVVGGRPEGGIRRASVRRGRQVVLIVTADVTDHVHLHGYDLMADVAPGAPAEIRFRATIPGRFEIELEDRRIPIGDLEVRP
jgi:hypothetical protein